MATNSVEYQRNITWMIWTESNKDLVARLWIPFQKFTTLLKREFQDLDRKTSPVNIFEIVMGRFSSREDISWHNFLRIGRVIINICGITSSHWTQVWTHGIWPENIRVKHHETIYLIDHVTQPLTYTILIMMRLCHNKKYVGYSHRCAENYLFWRKIISKISTEHNTIIQVHFSYIFSSNCFWNRISEFMLNIYISNNMINKDASS